MILLTNKCNVLNDSHLIIRFDNKIEYGILNYDKIDGNNVITFGIDFSKDFEDLLYDRFNEIIEYTKVLSCDKIIVDLEDIKENLFLIIDSINEIVSDYGYKNEVIIISNELKNVDSKILNDFDRAYPKVNIKITETSYIEDRFKAFNNSLKDEIQFRDYLIDLTREKNTTTVKLYTDAQVSKFVFSRILDFTKNPPQLPTRPTLAAISIALKLSIKEAEELYSVAGLSLTKTIFLDKVVRFFITEKIYDIIEVNCLLYYYNQPTLSGNNNGISK